MKKHKVFVTSTNITSPLGCDTSENFEAIKNGQSAVQPHGFPKLQTSFYSAKLDWNVFAKKAKQYFDPNKYTKAEALAIYSIHQALSENKSINVSSDKTAFVLSTTKGSIDLLDDSLSGGFPEERKFLWKTAEVIQDHFSNPNRCLTISNACISGVVGLLTANRLLQGDTYDTIIVVGVDVLCDFILSGFESFKALSDGVCKPYDAERNGINLGEAGATMILQRKDTSGDGVQVLSGAITNDANHISGPSRTGEGLYLSIQKTLKESEVDSCQIDYLSGHGTATLYNDEMESIAVNRAALSSVPMNSLKGYFGHTLGAAGVLESIITVQSLKDNTLIKSHNYEASGVSKPMEVIKTTERKELKMALKMAAGFGGSNASIMFKQG